MSTRVISVRGRKPAELAADPDFVYVGRAMPRIGWKGSPWGNPFKVHTAKMSSFDDKMVSVSWFRETSKSLSELEPTAKAVELHRLWLLSQPDYLANLYRIRGKTLGCWCGSWEPGQPEPRCHAVTLAKLADASLAHAGSN
ncbi:MAG: DUF4326 domain-containing protein [Gemmatimonadaceae bacterium]|nr:DUF4326 domain-containing protein [Gemmatimonadaceae bacterium]